MIDSNEGNFGAKVFVGCDMYSLCAIRIFLHPGDEGVEFEQVEEVSLRYRAKWSAA